MPKKTTKKTYTPTTKEKYMCAKHKKYFTGELIRWKKEISQSNSLGNLLNSSDDISVIDYPGFVDLCEHYGKIVNWF